MKTPVISINLAAAIETTAPDVLRQLIGVLLEPPPPGHCWQIEGTQASIVPSNCIGCTGHNRMKECQP